MIGSCWSQRSPPTLMTRSSETGWTLPGRWDEVWIWFASEVTKGRCANAKTCSALALLIPCLCFPCIAARIVHRCMEIVIVLCAVMMCEVWIGLFWSQYDAATLLRLQLCLQHCFVCSTACLQHCSFLRRHIVVQHVRYAHRFTFCMLFAQVFRLAQLHNCFALASVSLYWMSAEPRIGVHEESFMRCNFDAFEDILRTWPRLSVGHNHASEVFRSVSGS